MLPRKGGAIQSVAILGMHPVDYHQSRNDLATAQTMMVPGGSAPIYLMMQALTQNVRYTLTDVTIGSAPTATFGFQLAAGDPPIIIPLELGITVRVIEEAATAVLQYQWFN